MAMKANPFRAVRAESLGDQISRQLLSAIVQGHYPEGANLPCERELAGAFQVSVIAVREALSRLRHLGIVSVRQGRGTTVNPAAQWNTLAPEVFLAIHTNQAFEQLLAVRAEGQVNMLDTHAVQRIAFDKGFYELVDFIESDRRAYAQLILTGDTG